MSHDRLEAQRHFKIGNTLQRSSVIDLVQSAHADGEREIRVERERMLDRGRRTLEVSLPELVEARHVMRIGRVRVLFERKFAIPDRKLHAVRTAEPLVLEIAIVGMRQTDIGLGVVRIQFDRLAERPQGQIE